MNKSTIGTWLIVISCSFLGGFFTSQYSKKQGNFYGAREEQLLLQRIDSLKNLQAKSDTIIVKIKETKIKNHEVYITDTIYLNAQSFDSLKSIFLRTYPRTRYNSNKQAADSTNSKG